MKDSTPIFSESIAAARFAIAPLITLITAKILFELLGFHFPDLNQYLTQHFSDLDEVSLELIVRESKARFLWATSVVLYLFIYLAFAVFIWNNQIRSLTKSAKWKFILIITLISSLEIIYFKIVDYSGSPLVSIYRFTFDSLAASGLFSADELLNIETVLNTINIIAIVVPVFAILSGCCILQKKPTQPGSQLNYLLRQSGRLKNFITGASAIMVIGIIHMKLWLNWPLSFVADPSVVKQFETIIDAIIQYWGVAYTITIAALYLPAETYLSQQAEAEIMSGNDHEIKKDPAKWLKDNQMMLSPLAQLPQIVAVIAPMLVGSFASTLSGMVNFQG